ncbi:hypothetical protein JTB14_031910 [Gonioctena quinquepunctata]|nr:hypothetical protein JTB14_031910 [Gonioctena quinquepunctata]
MRVKSSAHRLGLVRKRLSNETEDEHSLRLDAARNRSALMVLHETPEERINRLSATRQPACERRNQFNADNFKKAINFYADLPCSICKKSFGFILPEELLSLGNVITCSRCSNNMKKHNTPPQAYWNNMSVAAIPTEIDELSEIEKRFICRVVPFLKIIKIQNRLSQDWCKGQAIMFAQDVVELAEQLPLEPNQAGLVLVVESLENLRHSRESQIDIDKLQLALQWLLTNNALYKDVRSYFPTVIDIPTITQIADEPAYANEEPIAERSSVPTNKYTALSDNISILHGSFHQGNERFSPESRGRQCTGIATVASVAFSLINPNYWCKSDIDYMLLVGDKYYRDCIAARVNPNREEAHIEYLAATELLPNITYNNRKVDIIVCHESAHNGHVDNDNSEEGFPNLLNALTNLFREHSYAILTLNNTTVAVHCRQEPDGISHWLFDSNARGPKGFEAPTREIFSQPVCLDGGVPNLDSVVTIDNPNPEDEVRLQEVRRKTAPPLNFEREKRMEELCWYFLFPDGKNGFGEEREVPITPLDYFQARVMIKDSCRMRQGQGELTPQGLIDNMHLTMRNVRGSASYWRRCCSELIAMVRSLGPPTWFMTFSCNDLNWPDMITALLIADGRDVSDVDRITFPERSKLVQRYPVVVARQFTIRVNALMRYLKQNNDCLGGGIIDFWYRIEFQNRGSPHLHMLVWCENIPDFSTNEGMSVIERVISCSLNPDNNELCNLVENVQMHKHTCYKDRTNHCCRFGFPRAPSEVTSCLGPDEALTNNGRFCILRRTSQETMVNNYSPDILSLWERKHGHPTMRKYLCRRVLRCKICEQV